MNRFENFSLSFRSLPIALLILGILAYGIHISWMGFYWDDWPWIWFSQVMGPVGMLKIDVEHRPFTGVVLWLGSIIAGDNPLGWQIYNFIWRFLGAVALGWALKGIWPRRNHQIAWITLLFFVYPGFSQQFVAVNNSRHIFPLITFFLSIGFMVRANRNSKRYYSLTGAAVLLSILTMFTTEYYYGLELIRPLILWLVLHDPQEKIPTRITKIFKVWLPYLIPLLLVFFWRYMISKSVNYGITLLDELKSDPVDGFTAYLGRGFVDIFDASITAWGAIFQRPDPSLYGTRIQIYFFGISTLTAVGILIYSHFLKSAPRESHWGREAVLLGAGALLVAPIPFWVTGLDPRLAFPGDRLNLPMIFGVCLLLVGLLDLALKSKVLKISIALLIGLSVGYHTINALSYRVDWQHQQAIFQQLTWRIPGLKTGTTLLSNELPTQYSTDNSLVAPLNWTYAPEFSSGDLPVFIYYNDLRFKTGNRKIEPSADYKELYRFYPFKSSSDQILLIYQQLPGCLRVLDSVRHLEDPSLPGGIRALLPFSNLDQIITTENAELPPPFKNDSDLGSWCYYFERADLARQSGDWIQVAQLGDLAFETGFPDSAAKHVPEYVVFIEGYTHTNQWNRATELSMEAYKIDPLMKNMLCSAWERIDANTLNSLDKLEAMKKINKKLGCDP